MKTESSYSVTPGIINPDDYFLQEVEIISGSQSVNIKGIMAELSYYEDIFRGSMTGHVLIQDSISLIDRMGMSGFEFLYLSFKKTGQDSAEFKRYFRIYRIGDRVLKNNSTEVYTIHFCSEELFLSEQIKISKSYAGRKISDIVYSILHNDLGIPDKKLIIGDTMGVYDFVIPYKKPFEAINWLANYSRPKNKAGADFVFYENAEGFNFVSLQELMDTFPYGYYIYTPRNLGKRGEQTELGSSLIGIKSYNILDTFDTLYGTNTGAFSSKLISIDPLTRSYTETKYDYSKYFESSVTLNKYAIVGDYKNRKNKYSYENYDAVLKVATSNSEQKKAKYISDKSESVANDVYVEEYIPYRTAQLALLNYSRIKIALSGDPNLRIGTTIDIKLPSMRGPDGSGNNTGDYDRHHSGKYLITSVRHIIDVNMKYETVLELAKDSFNSSVPSYGNANSIGLNGLLNK
jgi:hypothetical protein